MNALQTHPQHLAEQQHLTEQQLYDLFETLLENPGAAAAHPHLQSCTRCHEELLSLQHTLADLRGALTGLAASTPLPHFRRPLPPVAAAPRTGWFGHRGLLAGLASAASSPPRRWSPCTPHTPRPPPRPSRPRRSPCPASPMKTCSPASTRISPPPSLPSSRRSP